MLTTYDQVQQLRVELVTADRVYVGWPTKWLVREVTGRASWRAFALACPSSLHLSRKRAGLVSPLWPVRWLERLELGTQMQNR